MENKEYKKELQDINITLDGQPATLEQVQEAMKKLEKNKKIVEISPGVFKTLTRFQE